MSDEGPSLPPPPPAIPSGDGWTGDAPPPTPPVDVGQLRGLRTLSTAVMALVLVVGLITVASVPNDLAYISTLQDVLDEGFADIDDIEDIERQEDTRGVFAGLSLAALVAAGVTWIIWQQRARKCAKALGAAGQRHTEPLAALGWIVPFANFVIPKQVTNDLWRASAPEAPAVTSTDGKPVWVGIDVWWGLFLISALIGRVLFTADEPESFADLDGYISTVRLGLADTVLTLVTAGLAMVIVHRITVRLLLRAGRHGITV